MSHQAPNAVECAIAIQKPLPSITTDKAPLASTKRSSADDPIEDNGDLFGKAVQLAARLCALAEPKQILVDGTVRDQWTGKHPPLLELGEVTPKGFDHVSDFADFSGRRHKTLQRAGIHPRFNRRK